MTEAPGFELVAEVGQGHLQGGQRGDDVEPAHVAEVGDAEELALVRVLGPGDVGHVFALHGLDDLAALDAGRSLDRGQDVARILGQELEPQGLDARPGRVAEDAVVGVEFLEAHAHDDVQGFLLLDDKRDGRRPGRRLVGQVLLGFLGVEIELRALRRLDQLPGFLAEGDVGQARAES